MLPCLLPIGNAPSPATPQALRASSPKRGAKGAAQPLRQSTPHPQPFFTRFKNFSPCKYCARMLYYTLDS